MSERTLRLLKRRAIRFDPAVDIRFLPRQSLPLHLNGMRFTAHAVDG